MTTQVPTLGQVEEALQRCCHQDLRAAAHLMLPTGQSVGGTAHLTEESFVWRGFGAELSGQFQTDASKVRSVIVAGYSASDRFYDLSADEYTWLTLVPSGAGSVLAGVEPVLGVPRLYFDRGATNRAQRSSGFVARTLLAATTGATPSLVAHSPHPTWLASTALGLQVVTSPHLPEYTEADSLEAASVLFAEVAKLRLGWGGVEATTTFLPDSSVPGVLAAHVETRSECATVMTGPSFRQVIQGCHA